VGGCGAAHSAAAAGGGKRRTDMRAVVNALMYILSTGCHGSERCPGYTEISGFFRSTFVWNQIFNTKAFSVGPLTNIEFAVGADANTDK
jgi:hypothetical protein